VERAGRSDSSARAVQVSDSPRWEPAKDSSDGTEGFGTPLFSYPSFHDGNVIGHIWGPGPASLLERYGERKRSIDSGVPFGKGTGLFLMGRLTGRDGRSRHGGQQPCLGFAEQETTRA